MKSVINSFKGEIPKSISGTKEGDKTILYARKYFSDIYLALQLQSTKLIIDVHIKVLKIIARPIIKKLTHSLSSPFDNQKKYEKIVFIESTCPEDGRGLGDGIFKLPTIEALAKYYNTRIDIICHKSREDIFKGNPLFGTIHSVGGSNRIQKIISFISIAFKEKYELSVSINPGDRIQLLKLIQGLFHSFLLLDSSDIDAHSNHINRGITLVQEQIPQLESPSNITPQIYLDSEVKIWAQEKLKSISGIKIGLIIGAEDSLRHFKKWKQVIMQFEEKTGINFILIGSNNGIFEAKTLEGIKNVTNLVGTTTIKQVLGLINEMDLCIGADSGLSNAATALNTTSLTLFSSVEAEKRLPQNCEHSHHIQGKCSQLQNCYPNTFSSYCYQTKQSNSDHSQVPPCMESITPEMIVGKIGDILEQNSQ